MNIGDILSGLPKLSETDVNFYFFPSLIRSASQEALVAHPVSKKLISAGIVSFDTAGQLISGVPSYNVEAVDGSYTDNEFNIPAYKIRPGSTTEETESAIQLVVTQQMIGYAMQANVYNKDFPSARVKLEYKDANENTVYMTEYDLSNILNSQVIAVPMLRLTQRFQDRMSGTPDAAPAFVDLPNEVTMAFGPTHALNLFITAENAVLKLKSVPFSFETEPVVSNITCDSGLSMVTDILKSVPFSFETEPVVSNITCDSGLSMVTDILKRSF